jgi:hypothetical protein
MYGLKPVPFKKASSHADSSAVSFCTLNVRVEFRTPEKRFVFRSL